MAAFKNEQEIYDLIGDFFEEIKDSKPVKEMMQTLEPDEGYDAYCQFIYSNPDGKITFQKGENTPVEVICGEADARAELTFTQSADIGHQFWLGQLNLQETLARQQIVAEGPLAKVLKAMPQIEQIHPMYREYLKKAGKEELLSV